MSIRAIRLLTVRREEFEKQKLKSDGVVKAKRNQELDTQDISKKTNTSEAAREAKKADLDTKKAQAQLDLAEKKADSAKVGQLIGILGAVAGLASSAVKIGMKASQNSDAEKAKKDKEPEPVQAEPKNNETPVTPTKDPTGIPPEIPPEKKPEEEKPKGELASVSDGQQDASAVSPEKKVDSEEKKGPTKEEKQLYQSIDGAGDMVKNLMALFGASALKTDGYDGKSSKADAAAASKEQTDAENPFSLEMVGHAVKMVATGKSEQLGQEFAAIDRAQNGDSKKVQDEKRTAVGNAETKVKDAEGKVKVGDTEVTKEDIDNLEAVAKGGEGSEKAMAALKDKYGEEGFKALVTKAGGSIDEGGKVTLGAEGSDGAKALSTLKDDVKNLSTARTELKDARASFVDSLGVKGAKAELAMQQAELEEAKKAGGNESVKSATEAIDDEMKTTSGQIDKSKELVGKSLDEAIAAETDPNKQEQLKGLKAKFEAGTMTDKDLADAGVSPDSPIGKAVGDLNKQQEKLTALGDAKTLIKNGEFEKAQTKLEGVGATSAKNVGNLNNIQKAEERVSQASQDLNTNIKHQNSVVNSVLNGSFKTSNDSAVTSARNDISDLVQNMDKMDPSMREAALRDIKDKYGANAFAAAVGSLDKDTVDKLGKDGTDLLEKVSGVKAADIGKNAVAKPNGPSTVDEKTEEIKGMSADDASKALAELEKEDPALALQVALKLGDTKLKEIVDAGNKSGVFDGSSAIGSFGTKDFNQNVANVLDKAGPEAIKQFFGSAEGQKLAESMFGDKVEDGGLKATNAFGVAADDIIDKMGPEVAAKILGGIDSAKAGNIIDNLSSSKLSGQILAEIANTQPDKFNEIMGSNANLQNSFNLTSSEDKEYKTGDSELQAAFVAQLTKNGGLVKPDGSLNTEVLNNTGGDAFQNMGLKDVAKQLSKTDLDLSHIEGLKALKVDYNILTNNLGRENTGKLLASLPADERLKLVEKMMASDPEKLGKVLGTLGGNQGAQILKEYRDAAKGDPAALAKADSNILKAINQAGDQGVFGIQTDSKVEGRMLGAFINLMDKSGDLGKNPQGTGFMDSVGKEGNAKTFGEIFDSADLQTRTGLLKQLSKNENQTGLISSLNNDATSFLNINRVADTLNKMNPEDAAKIMGNISKTDPGTAGKLLDRMDDRRAAIVMNDMAKNNPKALGDILKTPEGKDAFNSLNDQEKGRILGTLVSNINNDKNKGASITALQDIAGNNNLKGALKTMSSDQIADVVSNVGGDKGKEIFNSLGNDTKAAVAGKLIASGKAGSIGGLSDKEVTKILQDSGTDGRGAFLASMGSAGKSGDAYKLMKDALKGDTSLSSGDISRMLEKAGPEAAKAFLEKMVANGDSFTVHSKNAKGQDVTSSVNAQQVLEGMGNTKNKAQLVNLIESDKTDKGTSLAKSLGISSGDSKKVVENMSKKDKAALMSEMMTDGTFSEDDIKDLKTMGLITGDSAKDSKAIADVLKKLSPEEAAKVIKGLEQAGPLLNKETGKTDYANFGASVISNMGAKDAGKILGAMNKDDMQALVAKMDSKSIANIIKSVYSDELGSTGRTLAKNMMQAIKDDPTKAAEVLKATEQGLFGGDFKIASNLLAQLSPEESAKILSAGIKAGGKDGLSLKDAAKMISGIQSNEGGQILGMMGSDDKLGGAELAAKILGKFDKNSEKSEYLLAAGAIDGEQAFIDKVGLDTSKMTPEAIQALKDNIKKNVGNESEIRKLLGEAGLKGADTKILDTSMLKTSGVQAKIIAAGINSDAFKTFFHSSLSFASNKLFDSFNNEQMRTVLGQVAKGDGANVNATATINTKDAKGNPTTRSQDYQMHLSGASLAAELVRNINNRSVRESVFGGFSAEMQKNMITSLNTDYSEANKKIHLATGETLASNGKIGFQVNDFAKLLGTDRNSHSAETISKLLATDPQLAAQAFNQVGRSWFFGLGGGDERAAIFNQLSSADQKALLGVKGEDGAIVKANDMFTTNSVFSSSAQISQQSILINKLAAEGKLNDPETLKAYGLADSSGNISDFNKQIIIASLTKSGNLDALKGMTQISQQDIQKFAIQAFSGGSDLTGLIRQSKIGQFNADQLKSLFKAAGYADDSGKINDLGIKALANDIFNPVNSDDTVRFVNRATAEKLRGLGLAGLDAKGKYTLDPTLEALGKSKIRVNLDDLEGQKAVSTTFNAGETLERKATGTNVLNMADLRKGGYISDETGKARGDYTSKNFFERTFGGLFGVGVSKSQDEYSSNENIFSRIGGSSLSRHLGQLSTEKAKEQIEMLYGSSVNKGDLAKSIRNSGSNKEVAALLNSLDPKMAADILREGIKTGKISHADAAIILGKLSDTDAAKILGQMAILDAKDSSIASVKDVNARNISGDVINKMGGGTTFLERLGYLGKLEFGSFGSAVGESWGNTFNQVGNIFTGKGDTSRGSTLANVQNYLNNNLSEEERAGAVSSLLPAGSASGIGNSKHYVNLTNLISNGGISPSDLEKLGLITKNKNGTYDVSKFFSNDVVDQIKRMPPAEAAKVLQALRKTALGDDNFKAAFGSIVDKIGSDKMSEIFANSNLSVTDKARLLDTAMESGKLSAGDAGKIIGSQVDSKEILQNMSTDAGRSIINNMPAVERAAFQGTKNAAGEDISVVGTEKEAQIGGAKDKKLSNSGGSTGNAFEYTFLLLNSMMPGLQFFFEQLDKMQEAQIEAAEAQKKLEAAKKLRKAIMGEIARNIGPGDIAAPANPV